MKIKQVKCSVYSAERVLAWYRNRGWTLVSTIPYRFFGHRVRFLFERE